MTRARELARLANENVFTAEDYNSPVQVGINSTDPTSTLDVRGQLNVGTTIKAGTAGVVTATEFSGSIGTFSGAGSFGGNLDVTGNVTIGGTLTYEDVTNIDVVGLITARSGVNVSGGQLLVGSGVTISSTAGVATFAKDVTFLGASKNITFDHSTDDLIFEDGAQAIFGTSSDGLEILHDGSNSYIKDGGTGDLFITGSAVYLRNPSDQSMIDVRSGGDVSLYYANSKKFETTNFGTVTTGIATATNGFSGNIIGYAATMTGAISLTAGSSANVLLCTDNSRIGLGNDADLVLYYDGPNEIGYINQINGTPLNLQIGNSTKLEINKLGTVTTGIATATQNFGNVCIDSHATGNGRGSQIKLQNDHGVAYVGTAGDTTGNLLIWNSSDTETRFATNNTERIRLNNDGKIQMQYDGTVSDPSYGQVEISKNGASDVDPNWSYLSFHRVGQIAWQQGIDDNNYTIAKTGGGSKDTLDTKYFTITNTGLIGIGTTAPSSKLTVAADSASAEIELMRTNTNTTGAVGALNWTAMDGHSVANIYAAGDGDNEGAHLIFKTTTAAAEQNPYGTGTIERLRITSNGDFGTGGVTPTAQSGRVFHLHAGAAQQRFHMTNDTTGSGATDGFEIIVEEGTDTRIRNFEAGDMALDTGGSNNEVMRLGSYGEIKFKNSSITERMHYDSGGGITGDYNHSTMDYGMVWFGATNPVAAWTMNIRGSGSVAFNDLMDNGTTTTFTQIAASSNASYYMTAFKIDGTTQTVEWAGGSAPSAATGSGFDSYVITIFKSASNTYKCFGNFTNFN